MKYMGSKSRIVKHILPIILEYRKPNQRFVDLFCGGCNVIQHVDGIRTANDKNHYLIEMWRGLINDRKRYYEIPRELYNRARSEYNSKTNIEFDDFQIGWIGWMGSFNGRFFDGGYSGHQVGKRDYIGEQIRNTEKQIPFLLDVEFTSFDYRECTFDEPCLIYCDIPYRNTKQYSTSKNFDHDEFFEWARKMKRAGHTVIISEYNAPSDFKCIWEMEVTNSMNTTKTYKPIEKLFMV